MSRIIINVENVSKRYNLGSRTQAHDTLRDHIAWAANSLFRRNAKGAARSEKGDFWALNGVSFEVTEGEVVGIIGKNGAGKSTILKILSRITEPTEGRVKLVGRVGSLLEVGTGFHGELSGRENIFLNGAILGMKRTEIKRKFDEIVAFAEIASFIDTPVKRYSSGMYVRLAFAVAAHLETEILLADEVLAVGDLEFQKKCLGKMGEIAKQGRTVMFVSHNINAVLNLCPRVILLRLGQLVQDGPGESIINSYLEQYSSKSAGGFENNTERRGNGAVRVVSAEILNEINQPASHFISGRPASFEFRYENLAGNGRGANIAFTINNQLGVPVSWFDFSLGHGRIEQLGKRGIFTCQIPNLPLPLGRYYVNIKIEANGREADYIPHAMVFNVDQSSFFKSGLTPPLQFCTSLIRHSWFQKIESNSDAEF